MSTRLPQKLRWKIWGWLTKLPGVCPANAHTVIVAGERRSIRIDWVCQSDCQRNGSCWCGKLREPDHARMWAE